MHEIRLRSPWQLRLRLANGEWSDEVRVKESSVWPDEASQGSAVQFTRYFQAPTGIATAEVALLFRPQFARGKSRLNGEPLTELTNRETSVVVTGRLEQRNLLLIEFQPDDFEQPPMALLGDVTLQILES